MDVSNDRSCFTDRHAGLMTKTGISSACGFNITFYGAVDT